MADVKKGDRVALVRTNDPYTKLKPGDQGTVTRVRGDTIGVKWDSGSTLGVLPDEGDEIRKVQ